MRGAAPASLLGFAVGYVGPDGRSQLDNLVDAAGVTFEPMRPVRSFPAYRGSVTTLAAVVGHRGGHVGFESWPERDHGPHP